MATPSPSAGHLAGAHVLLTGGTGFLGQALLEKLLSSYPTTRITLLIRAKGSASGADRLEKLLRRPVFSRWRERVGDQAVKEAVAERVSVIDAELGSSALTLPADLDVAIHSASTVSFDPPIDDAFRTNVQGVVDLYQAILDSAARPHVVHISTAYVAGARRGSVPEASLDHSVQWRTELTAAQAARESVEWDSRRPGVLRQALREAQRDHGKSGPQSTAVAAERGGGVGRQAVGRVRLVARPDAGGGRTSTPDQGARRAGRRRAAHRRPATVGGASGDRGERLCATRTRGSTGSRWPTR